MPKRHHATDEDDGAHTLCGLARDTSIVDNGTPTCRRCLKVIGSRCYEHNLKRCTKCPPGWKIGVT